MSNNRRKYAPIVFVLVLLGLVAAPGVPMNMAAAAPAASIQRLLIESKSAGDHSALRADLKAAGTQIALDVPAINMTVITTAVSNAPSLRSLLSKNSHVADVAPDRIERVVPPDLGGSSGKQSRMPTGGSTSFRPPRSPNLVVSPDPAFTLGGLTWNISRVNAPAAWPLKNGMGLGFQSIKVGIASTGLDYTHKELANKVDHVLDFTVNEQPNICSSFFSLPTDPQLATAFGTKADEDFNGFGTWIGGNIAASMNITGTNGIAPHVQLVALKVSQNCGAAYDSTIIDAMIYAAQNGIDVLSLPVEAYLDRSDPAQNLIYRFYARAVVYDLAHGTSVFAPAGNDHTRIGVGGRVISHGILDEPPGGKDLFGLWEVPGGVPGVVDVSATANVVNAPSATCPADSLAAGSHQWCKPTSDAHHSFGVGKLNQLTFNSNYGPRIDLTAPGGALKFNLPAIDRGGCEGWPWCGINSVEGGTSAADGYNAWQVFSITSNFATQVPCFTFTSDPVFPSNQCYGIKQSSSMAMSHVAGVAAIALSLHPDAWKHPAKLFSLLKQGATHITGNKTPPVSASDVSAGDLGGAPCTNGYCHLGGPAISDNDAYGYGLINAFGSGILP